MAAQLRYFYDPADYEVAATALGQLTAQQRWAVLHVIGNWVRDCDHPSVSAALDDEGDTTFTCPHCGHLSHGEDAFYAVSLDQSWHPYTISREDDDLVARLGEGTPDDGESIVDMCASCYRPVTLPTMERRW